MKGTIELYGMHYGPGPKSVTDSLFDPVNGRTLNGHYKKTRAGVILTHTSGAQIFIRRDGLGPVTTLTLDNGRRYYMQALCDIDAPLFSVPESYIAEKEGAQRLADDMFS